MKRKFFIDTDTASDDAVALIIALRHRDIDVIGIGVVAGNVPLEMGVQNALYTRELCGSSAPIYVGAGKPLVRELRTAQFVHGNDGMGDIGLDLVGRQPNDGNAIDELIKSANEFEGVLELVTLGPLTNIALALQKDPSIAKKIKRCVVMGAVADHIGNVTPVAEFNMWVDPEAVEVVLQSGMNLEFVGWDISRKFAVITQAESAMLRAMDTTFATFTVDIQRVLEKFCENETQLAGFDLPDPIAIAYAINSSVADEVRNMHLVVETQSPATEGMVVMDALGIMHQTPNALVVTSARHDVFMSMLMDALEA
jgi:purine nucleosidase